jgi:3-methyladenine DNA glycosylase/8-oxoguanine DNA glycosylase
MSWLIVPRRRAITFFPTPHQVLNTDLDVLRSAGLGARKAEYSEFSEI